MLKDVESIIKPMILTKRSLKTDEADETTDIGNQIIISSTAKYEGSDFHELILDYQDKIDKGNDKYEIISYDYRDGLNSGIFEKEIVEEQIANIDSYTKKMEYLNIFLSSSGNYVTYDLIDQNVIDNQEIVDEEKEEYTPPETSLEFEQPLDENGLPKYEYVLATDDADTLDDFAWVLYKLDDDKIKRVVNVGTLNREPIKEKIRVIRNLLSNFNIVRIVMDQRHQNITDNLAKPYPEGDSREPIIIEGDDSQKDYVKKEYPNTEPEELITIHNFTASSNEKRAKMLLSDMEKGKIKLPPELNLETKRKVEMYKEVKKMISQILKIEPEVAGKHIKYDSPKGKKKDLFTVLELGNWMCNEYWKNRTKKGSDKEIFIGKWS